MVHPITGLEEVLVSPENAIPTTGLSQLHQKLAETFNLDDLRGLCLDLNIDYEDLPGEARPRKIRELLLHLQQRDRLPELIQHLQKLRPHIDWASFQPAEPEAEPPFKGLQYFSEQDAHLFFGRDALTAELIDHLNQHRFLAVVGASGSGKSSVVRAGLLPAIRQGAVELNGQKSDAWPVHVITPGDEPLKVLATSLTRDAESVTAAATLMTDLRQNGQSLDLWLYRKLAERETRLLLVVDQFEELFTQCDDPEARRLFIENLVTAVAGGKQGRLSLVLTLRADFYAHAVQFEVLRPLLETRQKIVGAMTRAELRQAIEDPATANEWQFQPGLVDTILADVGATENRQPEPGALPLLSHALLETWHRREGRTMTLAGYRAAGGVRQAIATTADKLYQNLTPAEQRIARHIFLRLTELGEGTEDTRRRVSIDELMPQVEDAENVQDVLQRLASARLVITAAESAEVAHEALIREWPVLRQWLDENREGLRIHRQLTAAANAWEKNEHDPSYLHRGGRLAQAQEYANDPVTTLSPLERAFLDASIAQQQDELAEAQARAEREADAARKLGQRALRLRMALIIAAVLAIVSLLLFGQSERRADEARSAESTAEAESTRAALALSTAEVAQGELQASLATATVAQGKAEAQARLALAQSLASSSALVYQERNDSELAALLAIEAYRINQEEGGNVQWLIDSSLRPVLTHAPPYFNNTLKGHENRVFSVAFSPDGAILASGGGDNAIRLWNLSRPETAPVVLRGHRAEVYSVAFSPDGEMLASGSLDGTVRLWDLSQPEAAPKVLREHEGSVSSVAFSPDGEMLASGSDDATIRLWDLSRPEAPPAVLREHEGFVQSVAFSPDGRTLASGSADTTIRLWDLSRPEITSAVLRGHEDWVRSVAFSPNGEMLASGSDDGTVRLWELSQPGIAPEVLRGHENFVSSVVFSSDGERLASGGGDATIRLWELNQPEITSAVLPGHEGAVWSVAFSPDGRTLASSSTDATIRLWDVSRPEAAQAVLRGHESRLRSVAFSPDGEMLASGSLDGTVRLWDLRQPEVTRVLRRHENFVLSVAFSPDGETLASGSSDTTIRLWDLSQPRVESVVLRGHEAAVYSVAFSPDGETLASGSLDNTIRLWDVGQPETEPVVLQGYETGVYSVAFSPDGETLASGSNDAMIRLWDLSRPGTEPVVRGNEGTVRSIAFSPDGTSLASSSGTDIRLWDLSQPEAEPVVLRGHESTVWSVAFSPDGEMLASGSDDDTIRLWDLSQPEAEPVVLREHEAPVLSVTFSPDGRSLASGGNDDTIRLWIFLDQLVEIGCDKVRRNLTWAEWQRYLPGEPYHQTCPELPPHPSVPSE